MKALKMMWKNKRDLDKKILIDCDIIRHFIKGKRIEQLSIIFPNQIYILDLVEHEICRSKRIEPIVKQMINNGHFIQLNFPTGQRFLNEYALLHSTTGGPGESACMAVARFTKDIIASSNLSDIKNYCEANSILFLTTNDILYIGYKKGILSEADVNDFLQNNLSGSNPSKLPYDTLQKIIDANLPISNLFKKSA